jgi:hypothetical protein
MTLDHAPRNYAAAHARDEERASFIRQTYLHVFGAVVALVLLEALLLQLPVEGLVRGMTRGYNWLLALGAFMLVSWVAGKWAANAASPAMQYAGLGLYVLAEAFILLPLLYVAAYYADPQVIPAAGLVTLAAFTGLTAIVWFTGAKFSFLGPIMGVGGFVILGVIVCSILFGFSLGIFFVGALILFACGAILYQTSNVMHEYPPGMHVAAALALFAAVALLFFYVLQFFLMSRE